MAALLLGASTLSAAQLGGVTVDGSVDVGFDNQYNFRGVNFGENAPWLGVDLSIPLGTNSPLSLNVGTWYINPTEAGNDELDLYAFLVFPVADFEFTVGGTYFIFPETDSVSGEFGASVGYSIKDYVDLSLSWWTDVKGNGVPGDEIDPGHYIELAAGKSFELKEWLGLELNAGISYGIDYFGVDSLNHLFGTVGFPVALSDTTTLTPYVGGTFALEDLNDAGESDHFLAGVSLSVGF